MDTLQVKRDLLTEGIPTLEEKKNRTMAQPKHCRDWGGR